MKPEELENRLIDFSVIIIELTNDMTNSKASSHLSGQIIRSGTSVALNYGEAQGGESKKDFLHKMKIVVKELKETFICLKIIQKAKLAKLNDKLKQALQENSELISIFVASVKTAETSSKR